MRFFIVSGALSLAGFLSLCAVGWEVLLMMESGISSEHQLSNIGTLAFASLVLFGLAAIIELLWMLTGKAKADQQKRDPSA